MNDIHEFEATRGEIITVITPREYVPLSLPYFDEWVAALESNNYQQVSCTLCHHSETAGDSYCCLGVLSKIQGRLVYYVPRDAWEDGEDSGSAYMLSIDNPCAKIIGRGGVLPDRCWVIYKNQQVGALYECNDHLKLTFKDIAKIIKIIYKA